MCSRCCARAALRRLRRFRSSPDLTQDAGWRDAVDGCDYVLHVASPLVTYVPDDENELIIPAREGTLRVLRAARDAAVKRVVITSSMGAIAYGHPPQSAPFDETNWTNLDGLDVQPYVKSKTLAERAAWDFVASEGGGLELSVINPAGVFGPVLGPDFSGSIDIIKALLDGRMPAVPRIYFGLVDVRDVADLHLRAMTSPAAKGERFIAVAGETMSILEIAKVLRRELGSTAGRVPRFRRPTGWFASPRRAAQSDAALRPADARQDPPSHQRQGAKGARLDAARQ